MTLRIGIVTGEPSGDLLAKQIVSGLNNYFENAIYEGIGGIELASVEFNSLYPMDSLSVFGYVDAILDFPKIFGIYRNIRKRWLIDKPSIFLGIDLPDFNLRLERDLKKNNIPTIHFVSPSIWAWRYDRLRMIREAVSHMLVVFPFEKKIYMREGIPATYVGHPLAQSIPLKSSKKLAREFLDIDQNIQLISILPGSRSSEIRNLAPLFLQTAQILNKIHPQMYFIVPMANELRRKEFEEILSYYPVSNLKCFSRRDFLNYKNLQKPISWYAMEASDAVLLASGTATLEAALFKKPMVISYVVSPLVRHIMSWHSGQKEPYLPWIGLPNILSGCFVVPEFLQEKATPKSLAEALLNVLIDEGYKEYIVKTFTKMHLELMLDTPKLVAETIIDILDNG
ncbi:lipid-A-disaccharide synthase [Candidatus Kinetoplastibacterium desouzaii TCC079E]|uniref:Lipid-A-disaccharide synthase n=1 Tax=Candidatus Kinetoplastidibacterium desouzai TCC079E TaxID=1208919 RepID=M1M3R2_9PROT|nr:lipid-A-disaccharide synthase [Candidatus Kinetoplastibacterium desouzaii]AGF46885.1 lipid-A-disaccharide synthase [Candidatus Kinetoplastibacterium desouzaii TCC079E]